MLQKMRTAMKGPTGKFLIVLFTFPILFFGAESFFSVFNSTKGAININGEPISSQQVANQLEWNKQRLRQRFGEDFDMSIFSEDALREGAESELIERELLKQHSNESQLTAPDNMVAEYLRNVPAFMDESGVFSQDQFERFAVQQGLSTRKLFEFTRQDLSVSQSKTALSLSSFGLANEASMMESLHAQTRDIAFLKLELDEFVSEVELEDSEIEDYYQAAKAEFMTEELLRIEYLELSVDELGDEISVSDEEIRERFDQETENLTNNAERRASHILVKVDDETSEQDAYKKIMEIKAKLESGTEFGELAKSHSDDGGSAKNGGDLGFAGKGAYVPEFEDSLFSLTEGQVSDPVLTEFGYHLIKLAEIKNVKGRSFDKEKTRIEAALKREALQGVYQSRISQLEELVFETPDLDEAASTMELEIKVSDYFSRTSGEGIAQKQEIRDLAFSNEVLRDRQNSTVVEVETGRAIALRVNDHKPTEVKPLEEVKEQIVSKLKAEKAKEMMLARESELLELLKQGDSASSVALKAGKDWITFEKAGRRQAEVPPEVINEAFRMRRPLMDGRTVSRVDIGNDLAIVTVTKVHDSELEIDDKRMSSLVRRDSFNNANTDWSEYIDYLKSKANIVYFAEQDS